LATLHPLFQRRRFSSLVGKVYARPGAASSSPVMGETMLGMRKVEVYPYDALNEATQEAEVVVNASPLGMKDSDPLPKPAGHLDEGRAVCDAVYAPAVRPGLSE
jgi:shikimate 5-dehydrogenase